MTYAQLDTWSRGTKQSQTKPILPDLPLPSQRETALTSLLTRPYATTPQSQKQTQTKPICSTPSTTSKNPNTTKWLLKPQTKRNLMNKDSAHQTCSRDSEKLRCLRPPTHSQMQADAATRWNLEVTL